MNKGVENDIIILMTKVIKNETTILALSVVVLGIVTGVSSGLLSLFLDFVEQAFLGFVENAAQPAAIGTFPVHRLLSVLIGGGIAAVIWSILRTKFKYSSTIAKGLSGEKIPAWQTLVHVMTQIFYVGTGGSVGRELAPREAGAMFAQKWTTFLRKMNLTDLSNDDRKLLIAAAAGAGFAGVYIAPLTGMFFCVEILLRKITIRTVTVSLTMSVIAMLIGSMVKGLKPYYLVGDVKFSLLFMLFVLVVAPLCGVIGALFRKAFKWAEAHQTRSKAILWELPLMAGLTGLIAMIFPQIMGNGRALAQLSINSVSSSLVPLLLLGALAKGVVTVLTIRSGAAGGTLTPAIAIGAALGASAGFIFVPLASGSATIGECAVLGAVALLSASQQAPLMALFMMIEVSHLGYSAFLPLGLGGVLAVGTSRVILKGRN